jgi:glycosyltransferase involved in cell wall biosynthesis
MVTTFYPPYHYGGDAIFVWRLAQLLAGAGHQVDVVHSRDAYRLRERAPQPWSHPDHPNVKRIEIERPAFRLASLAAHQTGSPAFYSKQLRAILGDSSYDVIHFHNVSLIGGPGVLSYGTSAKLYTAHEYWLVCPTHVLFKFDERACEAKECLKCTLKSHRPPQLWRNSGFLRECVSHVDSFIFPSVFARGRHEWGGLDLPGIVLPHFVPAPEEQPGAIRRSTVDPRQYFLYAGRLEKLKGVQDIIGSFPAGGNHQLLVAGSGDYEPELHRLARGKRVRFLGHVPGRELSELYRGATAVIAPSLCYEVFHLVAAEALAHGTPVIARNLGAVPELIAASNGGIIFDSDHELNAAIDLLASDEPLRNRLARNAREAAARLWSSSGYLATYLALVDEILERRRHVPGQPLQRSPGR